LEENINSNNFIISIKIINQKLSDLSAFKNVNLEFLTELNLNENEIEDISPLENCNFQNLIYFDIEANKLNNKCLDIFKKISLPNVIWLNLFQNDIKSTEILEIIKNYKNLESFFIGENKFDKSELEKNKIYDFPSKLKEFGLTGNLTQETIDFILKLKIEKLEILYISRNQLNNLSFIKNIKFEKLKEFWVSFNNIVDLKEIENLQSKETIKKIILKGNKISNIKNILDVVKNFKNLKEINLENNPIKLINDNILQKLKEKEVQLKM
jgi:Leucine-rich repeat (LRR) protein